MKKVFIAFLILLLISVALIYVFIPGKIEITRTTYVSAVGDVTYRHVSAERGWERWWPTARLENEKKDSADQGGFVHDDIKYSVTNQTLGPIQIKISTDDSEFGSTLLVVPLKKDSTALHWKCLIETGNNPLQRLKYYQASKDISSGMHRILDSLRSFFSEKNNLYNIIIERTKVTDTILITTKVILNHYPTTTEIYNEINKLKQYITSRGAQETNYPMLHILKSDSNRFETMVAIPVNKKIGGEGDIVYKRMVAGNILVAKVKGGRYSIENAFAEMETYVRDHELIPPAIPFESLETNRLKEPDTTKWITRIYFPIL